MDTAVVGEDSTHPVISIVRRALFAALGATIFAVAKPEDNYWEGAQFFAFFLSSEFVVLMVHYHCTPS